MTIDLTTLLLVGLGLVGGVLLFFPKIRSGVARWIRVNIGGAVEDSVSPGDKAKDEGEQAVEEQKKLLAAAVKVLKQQKEGVVTVTAKATTEKDKMTALQTGVDTAVKNYNDAKELKASNATLDELALKVKAARQAVTDQEADLALANASAKAAATSLKKARENVEKLSKNIKSNEAKLALADVMNKQSELDEMTNAIDGLLSQSAKANETVDRILAEAKARQDLDKDTAQEELDELRRKKDAQDERDRLDGKTPTTPTTNG